MLIEGGTTVVRGRVLVALLGALASAPACAPDAPPFVEPSADTAPDDAIASFLTTGGMPAVAVAVVDNDQTLYSAIAGIRKVGDDTPVARDDAFQIGSMTKAMTALLAGTVVDAGQLTWDSTVGDVLGTTITVGAPYRAVTLAQLLNQESGIVSNVSDGEWQSFNESTAPVAAERRRMATLALSKPAASAPGTAFLYSNFNYVVVGLMLEVATGKSWETLMTERLFGPLGMTHAGFGPPATPGKVDAPWGHNPIAQVADNPPALGPAGTVHASLGDMLAYAKLYFDDGVGPNGRIISSASLARIETPQLGSYGFGWFARGGDGVTPKFLVHNGSNTFFYSLILIVPSQHAAIIMMTNRGDLGWWVRGDELFDYLAAHFMLPRRPK
jgi:D-alanyl-D-alanine carboxypeptidase